MTKRGGLVRTTLLLLPVQVIFRAGEALLPLLLASWFGRSHATDVYNFAWAVFLFAGSLVFSAYHDSALVPILAEAKLKEPASVNRICGSLLAYTWLIGGGLALLVAAFASGWFRLRYDGADFRLAIMMVPAFALQLMFMSTKTFFAATLSAHHAFVPYPVASAAGVLTTLLFIWWSKASLGLLSVAVATLLGEAVASLILATVAIRYFGILPRLTLSRPEPVLRFARLAASEVAGGAVTRVNPVVDQLMAGLAGMAGGATLLRYSNDVSSLPTSILQVTFLSVLLAHLADDFASRDIARIKRTVKRATAWVLLILGAASVVLFVIRRPLLALVFLHGEMDAAGIDRMASIFPYHLVGLAPFGVLLVLSRAHVAIQNSGIMFAMGVLNAGLNVTLNLILVRHLGVEGIARSTSLVHTAIAIAFWIAFQKKILTVGAPRAPETA